MSRRKKKVRAFSFTSLLLVSAVAYALTGNLSSCSNLPSTIFMGASPAYTGIAIQNDTALNQATWSFAFPNDYLEFTDQCSGGLVQYVSEVTDDNCSKTAYYTNGSSDKSHLTVSIFGCNPPLATRTSYSGLFEICYHPVTNFNIQRSEDLEATCSGYNNSSGYTNCSFSTADTVIAHDFITTDLPASIALGSSTPRALTLNLKNNTTISEIYENFQFNNSNLAWDTGCSGFGGQVGKCSSEALSDGCTCQFAIDSINYNPPAAAMVISGCASIAANTSNRSLASLCYKPVSTGSTSLPAKPCTASDASAVTTACAFAPGNSTTVTN